MGYSLRMFLGISRMSEVSDLSLVCVWLFSSLQLNPDMQESQISTDLP